MYGESAAPHRIILVERTLLYYLAVSIDRISFLAGWLIESPFESETISHYICQCVAFVLPLSSPAHELFVRFRKFETKTT